MDRAVVFCLKEFIWTNVMSSHNLIALSVAAGIRWLALKGMFLFLPVRAVAHGKCEGSSS
jgi:hypothetical protein